MASTQRRSAGRRSTSAGRGGAWVGATAAVLDAGGSRSTAVIGVGLAAAVGGVAVGVAAPASAGRSRSGRSSPGSTMPAMLAVVQHDDPVGQLEQLVEVLGDQQHAGAGGPLLEQQLLGAAGAWRCRGRGSGRRRRRAGARPPSARTSMTRWMLPPDSVDTSAARRRRPAARCARRARRGRPRTFAQSMPRPLRKRRQVGEGDVLEHVEAGHDGVGDRVLGHADGADARCACGDRAAASRLAGDRDRARRRVPAARAPPRTARAGRCRRRRRRRRARRRRTSRSTSSSGVVPPVAARPSRPSSTSAGGVAGAAPTRSAGQRRARLRPTMASISSASVERRPGRRRRG